MGRDGVVRHDLLANTQHTGTSADAVVGDMTKPESNPKHVHHC